MIFVEFTVGPIQGGGAHKVRASGNGLIRGEVNSISKITIHRVLFQSNTLVLSR